MKVNTEHSYKECREDETSFHLEKWKTTKRLEQNLSIICKNSINSYSGKYI